MANSTHPVPAMLGPGAGAIKLRALASNRSPHVWAPETWWSQKISGADLRRLAAQQFTLTIGTAPGVDGTLRLTFTGGGLSSAVDVDIAVAAADTDEDIAASVETDVTTAIAGSLAGVIDSVNNDGPSAEVTVTAEIGVSTITISTTWIADVQTFTATFDVATGGDGNYDVTIAHSSLPGGSATNRVVRAAAETDTNMADAMEAEIEADTRLSTLVANADNAAGVNTITGYAGVSGLSVTAAAPVAGGLVVAETTASLAVTQTFAYSAAIDLNASFPQNRVWGEVDLCWAGVYRSDAAAPGGTCILATQSATIFAVALDGTGWISSTSVPDDRNYEAMTLTATVYADLDRDEWFEIWAVLRKHQTGHQ